jgi:hypothetical protein
MPAGEAGENERVSTRKCEVRKSKKPRKFPRKRIFVSF